MEAACLILNFLLPNAYGLTTACYLFLFMSNGRQMKKTARGLLLGTLALHLAYLVLRGVGEGHMPLATQREAIMFFVFATGLVYLYLEVRMRTQAMGVFILAMIFTFQVFGSLNFEGFVPIKPILKSAWFAVHATTSTISFAGFAVAALLSFLYLLLYREITARRPGYIFQRIPSLEALDEMSYRAVKLAFALFTVGIISGLFWAKGAWERYWSWDPKEVSSIVVWLIYGAYIHARIYRGWVGKRVAVFAMIGFITLLFSFIFVNLLFQTAHRFI
jgi:cytochrome c-type biogenesis protein CcsB